MRSIVATAVSCSRPATLCEGAEMSELRENLAGDVNALFPIPERVLRKGFVEAGQEAGRCGGVTLPIEQRREETGKPKAVEVFRFLSERWPELGFGMRCGYLGS